MHWFLPYSLYLRHSSLFPFPIWYTLANVAPVTCVIVTCAPLLCSLFCLLLLEYVELCLECLIYILLSALMHILYSIYYEIMNALLRLVVGEVCICVMFFNEISDCVYMYVCIWGDVYIPCINICAYVLYIFLHESWSFISMSANYWLLQSSDVSIRRSWIYSGRGGFTCIFVIENNIEFHIEFLPFSFKGGGITLAQYYW